MKTIQLSETKDLILYDDGSVAVSNRYHYDPDAVRHQITVEPLPIAFVEAIGPHYARVMYPGGQTIYLEISGNAVAVIDPRAPHGRLPDGTPAPH